MSAVITDRFRMAAAEQNLLFQNVACTLDVRRINISKTRPANVTLTLPPMWNPVVVVLIIIAVLGVALYFGWWNRPKKV